jgi:hypothetical protein
MTTINATSTGLFSTGPPDPNPVEQLSTLSPTINITETTPPGCGKGKTPDLFSNVDSPTSSAFTSFFLTQPEPGQNIIRVAESDGIYEATIGAVSFAWSYRNGYNHDGGGISNLTAQIIKSSDGSDVGVVFDPTENAISVNGYSFQDHPELTIGSYKLRITYNNEVQDGTVAPGGLVTYTSEEWNVVDGKTDCSSLAIPPTKAPSSKNHGISAKKLTAVTLWGCFLGIWNIVM